MAYETIVYAVLDGVATITLNRPEKLNALSEELQREAKEAFAVAREDDDVRVIILKANGRAFSSGYELTGGTGQHNRSPAALGDYAHMRTRRWMEAVWWNPKPVIAQVHGYCLAGGGDLAAICDITIASDDAVFGYPVTKLNPHPPITVWPWVIGFKKTKELILTGKMISAHEAMQIGLVNMVVSREALDHTVRNTAQTIALSCDKRWQKGYVNAVYERHMGVGAGLETMCDAWSLDMNSEPVFAEWNRRIREEGLKSALGWRDARFREVAAPSA